MIAQLKNSELRPCLIKPDNVKGLFHCWSHNSEIIAPSIAVGGHGGGVVSGTFAIVEHEDGTVGEYHPSRIQFDDNMMKNYAFNSDFFKEVDNGDCIPV